MALQQVNSSLGEIVREAERTYIHQPTQISEYVDYSQYNTIQKIEAYLNSKLTSGDTDSLGRDKPFFNIVVAAANIWQRATDLDRKHIRISATKKKDYLSSFLATVKIQDWMKRERFGAFLNEWGRVLARYGSAIVKFVEKDGKLHISVVPWNRVICDPVEFDPNPKIEVLELTEAQLRQREEYDQELVEGLLTAKQNRETLDQRDKDTKSNYVKLYEVHGNFSLALYKQTRGEEPEKGDDKIFFEQMHVMSYVKKPGTKKNSDENTDFVLFSGRLQKPMHMLTHLIKEDGRTMAIGAVEHLFESQWMMNHTTKAIKDQLDLASKMIFQTSDQNLIGRNVLTHMETGDILIHNVNEPLTQLNNGSHDITALQNFGTQWKQNANEVVGVSEAMLGGQPKSGTAWRQTEALLQESHNLFELMTENKGLALEDMFREYIIPHVKKGLDTTEEISAILEEYDLNRIDSMYIKNLSVETVNKKIKEMMIEGMLPSGAEQQVMLAESQDEIKEALSVLGNQRFFNPSEIPTKTWKDQFKDFEWNVDINITGEGKPVQDVLATLTTVLQTIASNPLILEDNNAKMMFNKILEMTGAVSPIEIQSVPKNRPQPSPLQGEDLGPLQGVNNQQNAIQANNT